MGWMNKYGELMNKYEELMNKYGNEWIDMGN